MLKGIVSGVSITNKWGKNKKTKPSKTWKRANNDVNAMKLFVGDTESIPLKGSQITVKIDGFRARVVIDCFFYNNKTRQLEGTFKMKMPVGASPYFFAFGKTVYIDKRKRELPFNIYKKNRINNLSPNDVMEMRTKTWSDPKEARVVPKEKAALAYTETVRARIDPALAEWAGADIFNCRVFPLASKQMHRIVMAYDVNLTDIENDKVFEISIPKANNTKIVDIDIANLEGCETVIDYETEIEDWENRKYIHIENPDKELISIRYKSPETIILTNIGDEIEKASKAFIYEPWRIKNISYSNSNDILISGRPLYLYANQKVILSGRESAEKGESITIELEQKGKTETLQIEFKDIIETEITKRIYGQIAVNQLESFDYLTEKFSIPYAVHFAVPGKTCSMLMLESESDYLRFNIKPEENAYLIKESPVSKILEDILLKADNLADAKTNFKNWLKKFSETPGVDFPIPAVFEILINKMKTDAFEIDSKKLNCSDWSKYETEEDILEQIAVEKPEYDFIIEHANKIKTEKSRDDALKFLSTLIERNPSDGVMARDIAYTAMEWGLSEHAYYLAKRIIKSRPFEPQTYHTIAQILTKMNKIDLAVLFYEIAITANWNNRFGEFRTIAGIDYVKLLRMIKNGKYKSSFPDYVNTRLTSLSKEFGKNAVDLMIVISWNTDNTDVDLHIIEPTGEECYYSHRNTKIGGQMTQDVTQGYGPEMYTLEKAKYGIYKIRVKYYSSNRNRVSSRTKVYAVIYENRGKENEKVTRKVVTLSDNKEMHDIYKIKYKG